MTQTAPVTRGPFTDGPPAEALRVKAPSLHTFGIRELWRMICIYHVVGWTVFVALIRWVVKGRRKRLSTVVSEGVVHGFEYLGPTFVKLGQLIASSPGMFPPPLADACLRCLDEVPPFPAERTRYILERDLGKPVEELFAEFDDEPLSAASIAQVHACVLPDGRKAVVKVRRPRIRYRMTVDLRIMYRIARMLERRFTVFTTVNATGFIEDLHKVTCAELNFALEAVRQDQFRARIGTYGDNQWVTTPEVYWDYCTPNVICMERMHGMPMDEFAAIDARGMDGELMLRRGVKVWIESIAMHGTFHGDMHAGNLWVLDDGRLALLDFGIMGELSEEWRGLLRDLFQTGLDGDFARVAYAFKRLGIVTDEVGTDQEIGQRLQLVFGPMIQSSLSQLSLGEMIRSAAQSARQLDSTCPAELVLVGKQFAYFERYAKRLAPDLVLARDLFLYRNVFPELVAEQAEARGIEPRRDWPAA